MKNIKMKLIMISFCVSVIFITNVKALSIEDFNNSETVKTTASSTITREEYLKLKENYSVSINSLVNIAIRNAVTEEKMEKKGLDKLK